MRKIYRHIDIYIIAWHCQMERQAPTATQTGVLLVRLTARCLSNFVSLVYISLFTSRLRRNLYSVGR